MKTLQEIQNEFKECITCKTYKKFSEFNKRKESSDGLCYSCKNCLAIRKASNYNKRIENPEYHEKILEEQRLLAKSRRSNPLHVEPDNTESVKKYHSNNPEKIKAHAILNRNLNNGYITKSPCVICGETEVDGHHEYYSKPLEVIWLCRIHHKEIHRKFNTVRERLGLK